MWEQLDRLSQWHLMEIGCVTALFILFIFEVVVSTFSSNLVPDEVLCLTLAVAAARTFLATE